MTCKHLKNPISLGRTKILFLSAFLFLGLLSCRQVIPPPQRAVAIPPPLETLPAPGLPSSAELAKAAKAVVDIPPPIPVLPLQEGVTILPSPDQLKIVVKKNQRKLLLYQQGELVKIFPVDLGVNPKGPKLHHGDMKTPEGEYRVVGKRDRGQTNYYLAFLLNYPNESDRIRYEVAVQNGRLPKGIGIGGLIEIHGEGKGKDWTQGCIALINTHMQELFNQIPVGTTVWIEP